MPITRAMKARMTQEEIAEEETKQVTMAKTKAPKTAKPLTPEDCEAFIADPSINPLTGRDITIGGPKYNELLDQCTQILKREIDEGDMIINLITKEMCIKMVNESDNHQIKIPFYPKATANVDINSSVGKRILNKCKDDYHILLLHFTIDNSGVGAEGAPIRIPVQLGLDSEDKVILKNPDGIRHIFTQILLLHTITPRTLTTLKAIQSNIQSIIDANILVDSTREVFEDMLMEITAIIEGMQIQRTPNSESSSSSSINSKNRSKSLSVSSPLPPLSKKTRNEMLEDLRKACIEMRDMISLDEFEDMKKKKLQLIVRIGAPNKEGQQRCYYVKNIYDYVKDALNNNKLPKEPISKQVITPKEMEDVILPKMRYIQPNASFTKQEQRYPVLTLETPVVRYNDLPFYQIVLKRMIAKRVAFEKTIGFIPAYIETSNTDVNSAVVMAKIRELFDKRRLFDERIQPRVHINKSIAFWLEGDAVQKLNFMIQELNEY